MPDTVNPPVDNDDEQDPLPPSLEVFTSPALDHDQALAREVADRIHSVHGRLVDGMCQLEDMERALGMSEAVSARAHRARVEIQRAIAGFDEVIGGTDEARCALIFRWEPDVA